MQKNSINMRKILFLLPLLSFVFATCAISQQTEDFRKKAPPAGPAPKIELGEAVRFQLDNGLEVILVENHKLPRVSFQVFVDVPPFMEGNQAGYSSIAGQLLSTGTTSRTKAEIDEAVDFIGASLNTSANGVSGSCLTKHKDKLLELMADVLFNPTFPEEEFEKIKKQTLAALAQAKDDPNTIASNVATVLRNGKDHPYGELETEETVENIQLDKCKEYYRTYFKPNISYLVVTGDISEEEVRKIAQQYFGDWQPGEVPQEEFPTPEPPAITQVDFVDKAGAVQSVINITHPIQLPPGHPDAIKASLTNTILGGYFNSRLNANLREDKGYTYGARSRMDQDKYVGSFTAYASVRNEVTDSAMTQFLLEMDKLQREPVGEEELSMVKSVMTGSFARSLENPGTIARYYLNIARFNLPDDYYATYLQRLSEVTAEEVLATARKYIMPHRAHLLVVGNKDEVADKLKNFAPDGEVHFYDHYGNKIEEAPIPVPSGMTAETVLSRYVQAIGGDKLNDVQSLVIIMNAEMQGIVLETTIYHKEPNKLVTRNSMMGNIMHERVFDGESGVNVQMGQVSKIEGDELKDTKVDAVLFAERKFPELGVKTELKGIEMVNGQPAYKIVLTYPSGKKKTYYYNTESFLKVREVETTGGATTTSDIEEYMEVEGIQFPKKLSITGAAPVPIILETTKVEINVPLPDEMFIYEE
ncbi:MAG: peptidase M16 [Saprospirales bacterium]|nr:peptidase M16 [Saprospirales bacterium]